MHSKSVVFLNLLSLAPAVRNRASSQHGENASNALDLFLLPEGQYEGGKCMDGTQAGYYYGPPSSGSSTLWVIFLKGGGACSHQSGCEKWARGNGGRNGGSANWEAHMEGGDQLSSRADLNPDFHDAHHVYVPYCTGDAHLGQVSNPTEADHWGYYFDGHLNVKAIAEHLRATVPAADSMQRVLFQGFSAGGRGVLGNCDFLQDQLGASVSVMCNPFSGWFMPGNIQHGANPDSPPTTFEQWSVGSLDTAQPSRPHEGYTHPDCVANAGEMVALCHSVHYMYQYIKAPVYAVQDMFDTNIIHSQLGLSQQDLLTPKGKEYVAYIGNCTKSSMAQIANHPRGKQGDGLFLSACLNHGSNPRIDGFQKNQGLGDWFFGRATVPPVLEDACAAVPPYLPCNSGCQGMPEDPNEGAECRTALEAECEDATGWACLRCAGESRDALVSAGCTESLVRTLCAA